MVDRALRSGLLDRIAVTLSGLCLMHCVATVVFLGLVSSAAAWLGNPIIHEIGLALATAVGAVALLRGMTRHGAMLPLMIGGAGLATMATALFVPHGGVEIILTMAGVALLASAHLLNRRALA